ncbi:MAG: HEAT repeat domain-containing protein, partial [Thermoanaerobaculia bacterium]
MLPFSIRSALFLCLFFSFSGCVSFDGPAGPPTGTYAERIETYSRLLALEDGRSYEPLLTGYATASPDPWIRAKNALAIGRLKDPAASVHFPVLLRDPEPPVRRAAAFAAGLSGDRRLIRFLKTSLSDADRETASRAAEAIAKLGGDEAVPALLEALEVPSGPRAAAALALFRTPEPRVLAALLKLTADADPEVRRAVHFALARRPKPESLPALRSALE